MSGLGDFKVAAVIRADDYDRARDFYTSVLGLRGTTEGTEPTREGMFVAGEDTGVSIYERPGMPAPQNTTLAFDVPPERFDMIVDDLRMKGVRFEEYDLPEIGLKTENGVARTDGGKVAWFHDSEGNIVSIGTMMM